MGDLTLTLTQGNQSIPLIYDRTNQELYRTLYGYRVGASEPQPKWHVPNDGNSQLIDLIDPNSASFFTMDVNGILNNNPNPNISPGDKILNAIATLRYWVDGSDQEAARFHLIGDNNRVNLKTKRQNSTVTTVWGVIYGWVNDGASHYTATATNEDHAFDVVIALVLSPYGEAEEFETLKNELLNPDFLLESSTPGLADGWSIIGVPTMTLDTTTKLIGAQSQKMVSGGGIASFMSDPIVASSVNLVAFVWILVESGTFNINIFDDTTASLIATKAIDSTDSGNVSDKTFTDRDGNGWFRVSHSTIVTASNSISLRVVAPVVSTAFIDGAYMEFGRTDIPNFWSSYFTILNREDVTAGSPERVCHVNYWGISGDMPALVKYIIDPTSLQRYITYISKNVTGVLTPDLVDHWADSTELDTTQLGSGTGAWTTIVDASASGGSFLRWTEGTNPTTRIGFAFASNTWFASVDLSAFTAIPRRFFVIAKSNTGTAIITPKVWIGPNLVFTGDAVTVSNTSFGLFDCGTINLVNALPPTPSATGTFFISSFMAGIEQSGMASTDTLDIDAFVFLYADSQDNFLIGIYQRSTAIAYTVDGETEKLYYGSAGNELIPKLGNAWTLKPRLLNKVVIVMSDGSGSGFEFDIDEESTVETQILPRTKHLLGTL